MNWEVAEREGHDITEVPSRYLPGRRTVTPQAAYTMYRPGFEMEASV